MYLVPRGVSKADYIRSLRAKIEREKREAEAQRLEAEKQANKQQQNQTSSQLIQTGATLGGKYLYNQLPSFSEMGLPTLKEAGQGLASTLGFETGKEVATEAGKQALTEAGKEITSQVGQEVGKEITSQVGQEVGKELTKQGTEQLTTETGKGLLGEGAGSIASKALGLAGAIYGTHRTIQAIDGKQGRTASAISGATAGAGIGTMILPGIGTAIGAVVGAVAGGAMGHLRSGKSQAQQARDDDRKAFLHSMGREKRTGDFTLDLGDGRKFDFGLDGGAKYTGVNGDELRAYDLDLANPLANKASQYSQVMAGIGGFGGQLGNQIAQGIVSNSTDEASVKNNALKVLQAQGAVTKQDAIKKLQERGIDPTSARGILDDLYGAGGWAPTPSPSQGSPTSTQNPAPIYKPAEIGTQSPIAKPISGQDVTAGGTAPTSGRYQPLADSESLVQASSGFQGIQGVKGFDDRTLTPEEQELERRKAKRAGLTSVLGV